MVFGVIAFTNCHAKIVWILNNDNEKQYTDTLDQTWVGRIVKLIIMYATRGPSGTFSFADRQLRPHTRPYLSHVHISLYLHFRL